MRKNAGFTLLEILIAVAVLSVLMATLYAALFSTTTSYTTMSQRGRIEDRSRQVLDDMARELRLADRDTFLVTQSNGASRIDFRTPTGYSAGNVTWGPVIRFEYQPGDGDENRNGLEDDGKIVRIENGTTTVICDFVAPGGFTATQTSNNLLLEVTCTGADAKGALLESTLQTSVTFRNRSS